MTATAAEIAGWAMSHGAAQKQPELEQLCGLLLQNPPQVVLEIGTMQGGTLSAWCQCATSDALIVSVDLPGGRWGGGYGTDRAAHIRGFKKAGQQMVLIQGDSHDAAIRDQVVTVLAGEEVDFLFIDGDHSHDGVSNDFLDYGPLVKPGGLIAFHDIVSHTQETSVEVDRFWASVKARYTSIEFIVNGYEKSWGPWAGIGVVWKA